MFSEYGSLVFNATVLFVGAFVCGMIPLACPISKRKLDWVTTFGVGMLIGVAFAVIIPEGVHIIYSQPVCSHNHIHATSHDTDSLLPSLSPNSATPPMLPVGRASQSDHPISGRRPHSLQSKDTSDQHPRYRHNPQRRHSLTFFDGQTVQLGEGKKDEQKKVSGRPHETVGAESEKHAHSHRDDDHDAHGREQGHSHDEGKNCSRAADFIGHALVGGFLFMFLVETVWGAGHVHGGDPEHGHDEHHGHRHGERNIQEEDLEECTETDSFLSSRSVSNQPPSPNTSSIQPEEGSKQEKISRDRSNQAQVALVGILVHGAVDGMALGAIERGGNEALSLIVFAAIILHKAPAAFGLSSFLINTGLSSRQIQKYIAVFAASSPLAYIVTYLNLGTYGVSDGAMGICLIVSGGTFVYTIAAHILPETHKPSPQGALAHAAVVVTGALFPLWLMRFHSHSHGGPEEMPSHSR